LNTDTAEGRRTIILEPGKAPVFVGEWRVGEVLAMAQGLAQWVNGIPLREVERPEPAKPAGD